MSVGYVMLVHEALDRAAGVARLWAASGAPVAIHVDARVPDDAFARFRRRVESAGEVRFFERRACEWGTWSLVAAALDGAEMLLADFGGIDHVYLASGACLPLRPPADLEAFLDANPGTDFIESVTIEDVPWTKGGLDRERFTLSFPFAWKRQRAAFDAWVAAQRAVGRRRRMPDGLTPHLGSQWWCLTRETLEALLGDPRRGAHARFFSKVWIPDESYFQTLARLHSRRIESRSLTLSKFDFLGKPHVFYDDHLEMLRESRAFVARKIWPRAEALYAAFPGRIAPLGAAPPDGSRLDRHFARALERRTKGRAGLAHAGRFPHPDWENGATAARYAVFHGLDEVVEAFPRWAAQVTGHRVHGHLFAPDAVSFAEGATVFAGGISSSPATRDADPAGFLRNLVWNTLGERQGLLFGAADRPAVIRDIARDRNATVYVVAGAWALGLHRRGLPAAAVREEAARLQRREAETLAILRGKDAKARVRVRTLADFLADPLDLCRAIAAELGPREAGRLIEAPVLTPTDGLVGFLQDLKNLGMNPHLAGDVAAVAGADADGRRAAR